MKPIFPLVGQRGSSWATEAETGDDPSPCLCPPFVCRQSWETELTYRLVSR